MKGPPPIPKITPMAMMNPIVIDLSEIGVSFEIATKATGKNARDRRTCRTRVTKINPFISPLSRKSTCDE